MVAEYIEVLKDELADAYRRYKKSDNEGKRVIENQIREIKRDIERNSMKTRDDTQKSCNNRIKKQ